jgi:glycosyltransferase involved in cell wall biosynthesis
LADWELLGRAVVVAHNVESLIWQRYYEMETNPAVRWYIRGQWKKLERFEGTIFNRARRVVAVSDADASIISSRFARESVDVVDNGVDLEYFQPSFRRADSSNVLFLGSLDWRPNLDAARLLLDHLFPQLLAMRAKARLAIVGRSPPCWLAESVRRQPAAELYSDVPDVRPHLAAAAAMVVPLRIGGGTRLKILEAAAAGVPVVSTAIGAEGLSFVPGEHYLQANSPEQVVAALVRVLDDRPAAVAMAARARCHVSAHYGWPALADKLERVWLACSRAPYQPPAKAVSVTPSVR